MRNFYDLQSVAYLLLYVGLIVVQWNYGFVWWQYVALLFFSIGVQAIHHNQVHLGIWKYKRLNHLTNLFISVISAVPTAMMYGGHLKNHHVHQHGPDDVTRTYRFGGDHNHLLGYVLHPFQAFCVLFPMFWRDFLDGFPKRSRFSREILIQVTLIGLSWLALALLDWQRWILFVLVPQAFGLHWLLGANYLQHAHCDDDSQFNYARNFTGAVNLIWFNIGFHTAHHDHPKAHWSTLRTIHNQRCKDIDSRLCCDSFVTYVFKTFVLGVFLKSFKSSSLRNSSFHES